MTLKSILGAATALGLALAAPAFAQDPTKVGFIYVGPIGDHGWSYTHDQGRLAVEAEFGDAVETTYVETVAEGPDAERVMTQMALGGADIIFATSFGYGPEMNNVAARFPDIKFEHATGYIQEQPNVSLYNARFYEGRAVIGHIAGKMTENQQDRLYRVVPDSRSHYGHQRCLSGCQGREPRCRILDHLGLFLV